MRQVAPALAVLILALAVTGCADNSADNREPGPSLTATAVSIPAAPPGARMRAAYMELQNRTGEPIRITHVTSPDFGRVEIHETTTIDGIARMRQLEALEIPPQGSVRLERGGKHLMLMKPVGDPDAVAFELHAGDDLVLRVVAQVSSH